MNTSTLSTTASLVIPTNVISLSTYDYCNWLDHHIFKDTSLTPTGYNFTYPQTAYGGYFYPKVINFSKTVSGGPFYDICYQDFCSEMFSVQSINIYCIATVNFILSALDESNAKAVKIIYDFNDKSDLVIKTFDYLNPTSTPLKNQIISHTYYPSENFITAYRPSISTVYEDGCTSTVTLTLCSFKCGIIDVYEDVSLLDAAQTQSVRTIILTLENRKNKQVFSNMLDLDALVPLLSGTNNLQEVPTPIATPLTIVRSTSARLQFLNPIKIDVINYEYVEGPGINLTPDILSLAPGDFMYTPSLGGLIIENGEGAPYVIGDGITITPGLIRSITTE